MNIVVITAGGIGTRMHSKDIPKQFLSMHGKPIIIHTLQNFDEEPEIDAIVISCLEEWMDYLKKLIKKFYIKKVVAIVPGGRTGQLSIYNGLCAAEMYAQGDKAVVLVHDSVRPFIDGKTIQDNILSVQKFGSAITVSKVKETIVELEGNTICEVPARGNACFARAPQSFWLEDLLRNQRKALNEGMDAFVDSCSLMHYFGMKMHVVEGPERNINVTTPGDFYSMRAILTAEEDSQIYGYSSNEGR